MASDLGRHIRSFLVHNPVTLKDRIRCYREMGDTIVEERDAVLEKMDEKQVIEEYADPVKRMEYLLSSFWEEHFVIDDYLESENHMIINAEEKDTEFFQKLKKFFPEFYMNWWGDDFSGNHREATFTLKD